ncbi:MAG: hypothetical protein RR712_03355 [Terrisporobacter sp.]
MQSLKVGEQFKENINKYDEGCKFDITDSGCILTIFYNNPTEEEINDIKIGKIQYGYYRENNVIFMLFKFGGQEWMDCPYSIHLSKSLTELQKIEEGLGYAINIYLVDAATGIINAIRLIGSNTRFSKMLIKDLLKQKEMRIDNYEINLNAIYNKLSTKELVKRADIICKIE